MRNQRLILIESLLVLGIIGAGFAHADQTSTIETKRVTTSEQTVTPSPQGTTATGSTTAPDLVNAPAGPAIRWREFSGEVTHVNVGRQIMEIRLKGSHEFIGVPVDGKTIGVYKNRDHQYALQDIKPGDEVTVRNLTYNF